MVGCRRAVSMAPDTQTTEGGGGWVLAGVLEPNRKRGQQWFHRNAKKRLINRGHADSNDYPVTLVYVWVRRAVFAVRNVNHRYHIL